MLALVVRTFFCKNPNLTEEENRHFLSITTEKSPLYQQTFHFQKYLAILAFVSALLGWIFLIAWCAGTHFTQGELGGINFNRQLFNFHPVFMYGGMIFALTKALISYRILPFPKIWTKAIHITCHSLALICIVIGMVCVGVSNNNVDKNDEGIYYANLYSLHSFLGLATIFIYFQNYLLGFYHFISSLRGVSLQIRKLYMPIHVCLGNLAFILALITVETGISKLLTEYNCVYTVTSPDIDPASQYYQLTYGCKLGNGAGIFVLLVGVCGFIALYKFPIDWISTQSNDSTISTEKISQESIEHRPDSLVEMK